MKKAEIKQGVKLIKDAIHFVRNNLDDILEPYREIEKKLDELESLENESGIYSSIDFDSARTETLISALDNAVNIDDIKDAFENLISDLETWMEDVSETKQEEIQEKYIEVLNDIKDMLDFDSIECEDDLETQLDDMFYALDEMEI